MSPARSTAIWSTVATVDSLWAMMMHKTETSEQWPMLYSTSRNVPVGNDDGGSAMLGSVESFLHCPLTFGVQGRGGLIQNEDLWPPH